LSFLKVLGSVYTPSGFFRAVFLCSPFAVLYSAMFGFYYSYFSEKVSYTTVFMICVGISIVAGYLFDYFVNGGRSLKMTEYIGVFVIMAGVLLTLVK
jgi:hypothetical protein